MICKKSGCDAERKSSRRPWCVKCHKRMHYWRQKKRRIILNMNKLHDLYDKHTLGKEGRTVKEETNEIPMSKNIRNERKRNHVSFVMDENELQEHKVQQKKLRSNLLQYEKEVQSFFKSEKVD